MDAIEPALIAGIKLDDYWNYTIVEILIIIDAYKARIKQEKQIDAFIMYQSVSLMQYSIASVLADKKEKENIKFPSLEKTYSIIFDYEENEELNQQDYRIIKERLLEFAEINNRKYQAADNE